jgi:DNA-binding transcriptional LysR family regulator
MIVELRNIRHFLALAEERHMTRAAARELIVQSGLSSSIAALERDVGAPLYIRNSRPIELTAEGEALIPYARKVLAAAEEADRVVREVHGAVSGQLTLGVFPAGADACPLAAWLGEFTETHSRVRVRVVRLPGTEFSLGPGALDVVIAASAGVAPGPYDVTPLSEDRVVLVAGPKHPLAGSVARLGSLAGLAFVETPDGWPVRQLTDDLFAGAGLTRETIFESEEWPMLLDLVRTRQALAFVPEDVAASSGLPAVAIEDVRLTRRVELVVPRGQALSPAARAFATHVMARRASVGSQPTPRSR